MFCNISYLFALGYYNHLRFSFHINNYMVFLPNSFHFILLLSFFLCPGDYKKLVCTHEMQRSVRLFKDMDSIDSSIFVKLKHFPHIEWFDFLWISITLSASLSAYSIQILFTFEIYTTKFHRVCFVYSNCFGGCCWCCRSNMRIAHSVGIVWCNTIAWFTWSFRRWNQTFARTFTYRWEWECCT